MKSNNSVITFWIERNLGYRQATLLNLCNLFSPKKSMYFLVWWDNGDGYSKNKIIASARWLSEAIEKMELKMQPFLKSRYRVRNTRYSPSSSQVRIVETKIAVPRLLMSPPLSKGE